MASGRFGLKGRKMIRRAASLFCKVLVIIAMMTWTVHPTLAGERDEYIFAYKLFQEGAYFIAKDALKTFIQDYPQSIDADDARFLMGECALQLKEYDEAIQHYKQLQVD